MAAMRVVEMPVDQIVNMIAVRNRFVAAAGTVLVSGIVPRAGVIRRAGHGISRTHFDGVLIYVIPVRLMQVAVVQVVHMIAVLDGHMAAPGPMDVGMAFVDLMFG